MLRAMVLCLVAVVAMVSTAFAALTPVPIEGKLLVTGWDDMGQPVSYYLDGSSDTPVTTLTFFFKGNLSPDGMRVAYNVLAGGSWEISTGDVWVADLDSSGEVNLTSGLGGVNCTPKWSPDGKTILFQHAEPASGEMTCDAGWTMWLVDADGSNLHQCGPAGLSLGSWPYLGWAPDGYHITGISTSGYFITDIAGSSVTPLPALQGSANWSNDGSRLVCNTMVPGTVDGAPGVWRRLSLADADGSNPQVLVEQFLKDSDVEAHIALHNPTGFDWVSGIRAEAGPIVTRWSPMGDQVAFVAALPFDPDGPWVLYQREVWRYDLQTQQLAQLTQDSTCEDYLTHGDRRPKQRHLHAG
jgi:Tol biopolymer transport system component